LKRSAGKIFIKGMLLSFIIVAILLSAGILGYRLTMHFFKAPEEKAIVAYQDETVPETVTEASVDDISRNLIFCYDEKTSEITKIVLEIFHCGKKKITYITIPMRTQLTMSDSLYRKMLLVNPEIPQMMQLSVMTNYMDSDTVFDYGTLMLEDLLGIKISYYTVIPKSIYDTMFVSKKIKSSGAGASAAPAAEQNLPVEAFSKDYIKFVKTLKTEDDINNYIEDIYPKLITNLPLEEKQKYLESYSMTPLSNISFELMKGNDENSGYYVDPVLAASRLNELMKAN